MKLPADVGSNFVADMTAVGMIAVGGNLMDPNGGLSMLFAWFDD